MPDRRRQVILLLATRFDWLYLPPGSLTSRGGFVPAVRVPCGSCGGVLMVDDFGKTLVRRKGRGRVLDRFGREHECSTCLGAGETARDPMDSLDRRVGSEATVATAAPRRTVPCDRCGGDGVRGWEPSVGGQPRQRVCESCGGSGKRDLHAFDLRLDDRDRVDVDQLTAAIAARDEAGSYHELDRALAGIAHHVNKPSRFSRLTAEASRTLRLLDEVYLPPVDRDYSDLESDEQQLVELALEYVEARMPNPLRVPAYAEANAKLLRQRRTRAKGRWADPRALAQRDREIRKLARSKPVQWIAAEYGISVDRVYEAINEREAS